MSDDERVGIHGEPVVEADVWTGASARAAGRQQNAQG
jgi:hypothetical protein